jgi:hypothetical protein
MTYPPASPLHSNDTSAATEIAIHARLLLLWPVAGVNHRSASDNPYLAATPFTALPWDCSFGFPEEAFLNEVLFRVLRLF